VFAEDLADQDISLHMNAQYDKSLSATLGELRFDGRKVGDYLDILVGENGLFWVPIVPVFVAGEASVLQTSPLVWELTVASLDIKVHIDLANYQLTINDQPIAVNPGDMCFYLDELFIRSGLLTEAIGLAIDFDPLAMVLDVKTTRPWPRVLREARELRWRRLGVVEAEGPQALTLEKPYSIYGATQANIRFDYSDSTTAEGNGNYSVQAVSEALFLTNRLTLSGDQNNSISSAHITSGRKDPRGSVFGLKPLYDVSFGDVSGLSIPLAGSSGQGVGIRVQAAPLTEPDNFDLTVVEGDGPPGWEAELYLDSRLYDYQIVGADGRYRFENVPLDFGTNALRVVLYSPAGETREIDSSQIVGSRLKPGQVNWWAHLGRPGTKIFHPGSDSNTDYGVTTGSIQADIGVNQNFKLGASFGHLLRTAPTPVRVSDNAEPDYVLRDYIGLRLQPTFQYFSLSGEGTLQDDGAKAYALRGSFPVLGTSIGAGYEYYDADFFSSMATESSQSLMSKASVRGSIPLNLLGIGLNNISLSWDRSSRISGEFDDTEELIYAHRIAPLSLSHRITRRLNYDSDGKQTHSSEFYRGLFSYRKDLLEVRGELDYDLYPVQNFQNARISATYHFPDRTVVGGGFGYSASGAASYNLSLSRMFKAFTLSLGGAYSEGNSSIGLSLSFGLGHVPGYGCINSPNMDLEGGMALMNLRNDSEQQNITLPLDNIRMLVNKRRIEETTDPKGRLLLSNLDTLHVARLAVQRATLPDPFLVADVPEVMIWPRAGQVIPVDVQLKDATFVSGMVYVLSEKQQKIPGRRLRVQLLNGDGLVSAETITMDDGFYQFETAYPGSWSVRLAPGQPNLKNPLTIAAVPVAIDPGELEMNNIDLVFYSTSAGKQANE